MKRQNWLFILVGGCMAMSASAQETKTKKNEDLSFELNPVVVTGTGTHHRLKDTPTPVSVITANEIKKAGITDFREAMAMLEPSLSFQTNAMGDYLMMNGLSNKYVLILINGKKLTGDSDNNIDLNRIDMSNVKRIEILKGAGSALYGSDAIGGVINIITNQPYNLITVTSNTKVEERGQFSQTVNLDITTKKFGSYTSYQRRQAEGWCLTREEGGEPRYQNDANAFYTDNYSQMFRFTPNEKFSAYVEGNLYDRKVKRQPEYSTYNLTYDAYSLGTGFKYNFNKKSYLQFDLRNDNYDTNWLYNQDVMDKKGENIVNYDGEEIRQKRQHYYSGNLKSLFRFTENTRTIFGVEYIQETLDRPSFNVDERAYTWAAYAQEEITLWKNLQILAGLRYVYHETAKNNITPKVSLMYRLGDFTFRGQYSAGFRAPGLDELYKHSYSQRMAKSGGTLSYGNKYLKAEKSNYGSINVEFNKSWLTLGVTGYINEVRDMIVNRTVAITDYSEAEQEIYIEDATFLFGNKVNLAKVGHFVNNDKALIKGFEVNLNANIGYGFSLGGNYTFADARTKDIEQGWRRIERSVRHSGNVNANYAHSWKNYRLNVNLNSRIQSKRTHLALSKGEWNDTSAPGFALWNISTRHAFDSFKNFSIEPGVGINNIFNYSDRRPDADHLTSLTPGRTVFVSLLLRFKQ
ncbi:TonB-dependent receptor [Bacteroides sp.]|uniref:TonB-dependent receptor plug domain-containing protein n=1 Tax=Bacteroides sp. TaxID=29523 RepID=UPI00261D5743|nr:TonB-dependent receptor [Bacteroides sp.]